MTISVAIATYNRAEMLRECLRSASAQSLPAHEIIVSDDASTDGTREVLNEHRSVKQFRQSTNTGGVPNWNAAVERTSGEFIAWCSDDDRLLPDHIETSVRYLLENSHVGLVHSAFVDSLAGRLVPRPMRSESPVFINQDNWFLYFLRYYNWPFHPSTIVMRREVWEHAGPFDPRYAFADTDWFIRAVSNTTAAWLPRYGVISRRHRDNWSNRLGTAQLQQEISEIVERALQRQYSGWSLIARRASWRAVTGIHRFLGECARRKLTPQQLRESITPV